MKMTALNDFILVKMNEINMSPGGVALPADAQISNPGAKVLSVGPDVTAEIKVGDTIYFQEAYPIHDAEKHIAIPAKSVFCTKE